MLVCFFMGSLFSLQIKITWFQYTQMSHNIKSAERWHTSWLWHCQGPFKRLGFIRQQIISQFLKLLSESVFEWLCQGSNCDSELMVPKQNRRVVPLPAFIQAWHNREASTICSLAASITAVCHSATIHCQTSMFVYNALRQSDHSAVSKHNHLTKV